jgi:glycine C-acetyltransferase
MISLCSNDYLGLANAPEVIAAATRALTERGFGTAGVRFVSGTQDLHLALEQQLAQFLGTESAVLFSSCFDANTGLFEALWDGDDAIVSDELNHASLIDGIRLSRAHRLRFRHRDMSDLEDRLRELAGARRRVIVTDGVFSMDGTLAPLREICDLAASYDASVVVDDSHAVGVLGRGGRGTPEHAGVVGRVDVLTGTFGKALGGAAGGWVAASSEITATIRCRARPYVFSNALAPALVAGAAAALDLAVGADHARQRLMQNALQFRGLMTAAGFEVLGTSGHPIIPVLIGDDNTARRLASAVEKHGILVTAFTHPVVPHGGARIRVQLSAAHTPEDVVAAVAAFTASRDDE